MKLRRQVICVLLVALWAAKTSTLRADGLVRDGVGPISTGRGGTNLAHADNGAILLDNPAGMMNAEGCGLHEIGLDTVFVDLDYSDPFNRNVSNDQYAVPAPELAYFRKSADGEWAYGIGAFVSAGFGANYHMDNELLGRHLYKTIGGLGKILPALAYRLTDDLSIGGTLGLAISDVELEGPFFLQTGAMRGVPTLFDMQAHGFALTGSLGLQYQWSDSTTLGICYSEESRFHLKGSSRADVFGIAPVPLSSEFDTEADLTWPRSLGIGVKHDLCCCRRVSADVIWYNWSNAFDAFDLRLSNPTNGFFNFLGPVIRDSLPMEWHDTVSVRLGYEWDTSDRDTWRLGYVFHESPVPDSTLNPYLDGVLEHAFTAGYSRKCQGYSLNVAYEYSFSPERHVEQSDLAGGDFDHSSFQAQAHWVSLSVVVPY